MSEINQTRGVCRACGCTESQACVTDEGPCAWADRNQTLCTVCAGTDGDGFRARRAELSKAQP